MNKHLKALDIQLKRSFAGAQQDLTTFLHNINSLENFKFLYPTKHNTSLRLLSRLPALSRKKTSKLADKDPPSLQVILGVGKEYTDAKGLYAFFNGILEFEPEAVFNNFCEHGYSLVITGGAHDAVVAAAVFIIAPDGIFVDAIAVSHGRHENACKLTPDYFKGTNEQEAQFLVDAKGSFQRCGLGSFMFALLSRIALLKCDKSPGVFLKANLVLEPFYTACGFESLPTWTLPTALLQMVPPVHFAHDSTDLTMLMVHHPPSAKPIGTPVQEEESAAAALLALVPRKKPPVNPDPSSESDTSTPSSESDTATPLEPESDAAKKRKRQQLRRQQRTAAQAVVTVEIAVSDDEGALDDYDNYARLPDPGLNWTLPQKDYWEPQTTNYKIFKAKAPVSSHQPTQNEVAAKYNKGDQHLALGRLKVLRQARVFQTDTEYMQAFNTPKTNARYPITFTPQQYVDLAAVADLHRPLLIPTRKFSVLNGEVTVSVSSYVMPKKSKLWELINNRKARKALRAMVRTVKVSVSWLRQTTRPEIADWIDQSLSMGTKVLRVPVDNVNVGTDPLDLAFSGSIVRDNHFVSIPQGHVPRPFGPKPPDSSPDAKKIQDRAASVRQEKKGKKGAVLYNLRSVPAEASIGYYDIQGNATALLRTKLRAEATKYKIPYAAPPPKAETQVVKLKWVPTTRQATEASDEEGVWRGAFAVRLGEDKSTTVLQECGLTTEWVEDQFALTLRQECKNVANGRAGKRNPKKFLFVPAGDVHDTDDDPPPPTELVPLVPVAYLQGNEDSCLRLSMASALAAMGFDSEALVLASTTELVGCRLELIQKTSVLLPKLFVNSNLCLRKVHNHACSISDIGKLDASWPIVLVLQTEDGCHGTHAVTTWNRMIFDSNCERALRWSQKSLDWCSGKNSACVGFSRAYRICPADLGQTQPQSAISIGLHVRSHTAESNAIGWVMRLPSKKKKGYHVRHTNGRTECMTEEEVNERLIQRSPVGGL